MIITAMTQMIITTWEVEHMGQLFFSPMIRLEGCKTIMGAGATATPSSFFLGLVYE